MNDKCPHGVPIPDECISCHKDDSLLEEWVKEKALKKQKGMIVHQVISEMKSDEL